MDGSLSDGPVADAAVGLAAAAFPLTADVDTAYAVTKTEDTSDATGHTVKKRKFAHTNEAQRRCLLEWLELPGHFRLLVAPSGSAASGKLANGKKVKKTDGFRALMRHVNTHTGASWSMDITKSRFESFLTSYRKVQRQSQQPAFALTENDRARGITDITQKRNALCLFYDRIDALFSTATSVGPLVVDAPTLLAVPETASTELSTGVEVDALSASEMGGDRDETIPQGMTHVAGFESDEARPAKLEEQPSLSQYLPPAEPEATAAPALSSTEAMADSPPPSITLTDEITLQQLAQERERLDLLQEQLAVQKRELEIKERELQQQENDKRMAARAELAVRFAQAGKSVAEIKELLELIG